MRKPVLGRGLGRLMQSPETTSSPEQTETLAPGLKILIRGAEGVPPTETTAQQAPATPAAAPAQETESPESQAAAFSTPTSARIEEAPSEPTANEVEDAAAMEAISSPQPDPWRRISGVALLVADLGLVVWPTLWIYQNQNTVTGWGEIVACSASVMAGAAVGVLGVRLLAR